MLLRLTATNTAGVTADPTKTVDVDNSTPTISISGPTNALSTAGTQYITATASGSPSGIDGFSCSIDGGPAEWFSGASARVPVSGVGEHTVSCSALNNAVGQLLDRQSMDGAFGLWRVGDGEADPWLGAYATDFLLEAQKLGAAVPQSAIDSALNAMRQVSLPDGASSVSYQLQYPDWWGGSPDASKAVAPEATI